MFICLAWTLSLSQFMTVLPEALPLGTGAREQSQMQLYKSAGSGYCLYSAQGKDVDG